MWRFLRDQPGAAIIGAIGMFLSVGSRVNDAYSLINAGLPSQVWEALGLAIFFVAIVILLYRWHHTQVLTETKEQDHLSVAPAPKGATSPTIERYIDREHSSLFLDPPKRELWKAQIRFARGGDKLKFRLDYSSHSGGPGKGFWSEPRHLLLRQQNTFAKGQDITIDLMALDDSEPRRFWRWTVENDGQPLVSPTMHHCRLAFVVDDRVADDFNFIVVKANDNNEGLLLLGENHFSFASEWRGHDGRHQ